MAQHAEDVPPLEAMVNPSEITKRYDFEIEKKKARNFLAKLKFVWKGGEKGGFATIETFMGKLNLFKADKGSELKVETEYIEEQVQKAMALANNCFDKLGLRETIEDPNDENVYLPYHGKTHARNTLFNGMGAWLVKVQRHAKQYGLDGKQQQKWVAIGARVLAMHEIDDWWEPTSLATDEVKVEVRQMIIADLAAEGIDPEEFDDYITLDNYMVPVSKMMEVVKEQRKGYLVPDVNAKKQEKEREVNRHPDLVEALGDTVVGADFMQALNSNYQEEIPVLVGGKEMKIMAGPLTLLLEMFLVMPQRIPKNWQKLAGYLWTIDYKEVGLDPDFLEKIREKTAKHWGDMREFNEEGMTSALVQFQALEKWVGDNESEKKK